MAYHSAIVTTALRAPLALIQVPTVPPAAEEVLVWVEFVASTPLDLHQNDGGLLVTHPQVLGDSVAGTVVQTGEEVEKKGILKVGDRVFGFTWREQKEKGMQEFVTVGWWHLGKVPEGLSLQEAVTVPNNFVTAWHTLVTDLAIELPWPKPDDYVPSDNQASILVWGGSSSVGQYATQILHYYGYRNIISTASVKHHPMLQELGASKCFDYRSPHVLQQLFEAAPKGIKKILDCIGSLDGSIKAIAQIAERGARVAILLPVIVRDATETQHPEYAMDVMEVVEWEDGVDARGVRTHFYMDNVFRKWHLQPEIMPTLLEEGTIRPNRYRLVEGETTLERAQNALDILRRKEVSGEGLVWKMTEA
ncbi:GroES-like protein [Sporormia fimetaria CBS 119925]|uniref:GroES-like protein n=1 Tax=Sporormia fimetaria CBS 119925 TaxID=1340428 RepID=A0A6A6UZL4_9PLEO|nr:GroES-like protein [Sporormia fimetaria CBS 119925]